MPNKKIIIRQIVIIAGGLATRLHPITKKIPKSMVPIAGKPFLEHQLKLLKRQGIKEAVLCVGHLSRQIEDYFGAGKKFGIKLIYSKEPDRLDTGGAIKNAYPYLDNIFFTLYGDSYLKENITEVADFYHKQPEIGLMTVWRNQGKVAHSQILVDGIYVTKFHKEPTFAGAEYIEYGLNILPKKIINAVPDKVFPISRYFDMLIPAHQMLAYKVKNRFYEIGGLGGLRDTETLLKGNHATEH